jgi:hypothetical protein
MVVPSKKKKRGLVMTGGGAKGFYEAGVMHALHLTGTECDVVTGSSIGAMNSLVYAEYLSRKRSPGLDPAADAEGVNIALDHFMRAFLYAWLNLEFLDLIKDDDQSVLAQLKNDLVQFSVDFPLLVRLLWWQTTPEARRPSAYFDVLRLAREVAARLGWEGLTDLVRRVRAGQDVKRAVLAAYLKRHNLGKAIILPDSPGADSIVATFTGTFPVLEERHLALDYKPAGADEPGPRVTLLARRATLSDFEKRGVEVRLTRANYRTGRLELSACYTLDEFAAYLDRQAWRLMGPELKLAPIGSHRLQVPGNPFAIDAALASGRFPGVFAPYSVQSIYDLADSENDLLRRMLTSWLDDAALLQQLKDAYPRLKGLSAPTQAVWDERVESWHHNARLRSLFPHLTDTYVDGGAIDNTPSNSAVDAVREWLEANQQVRRDYALDLFVVFLNIEPVAVPDEAMDPELYQVVKRTLDIQATATLTSDAVVVDTINGFGERGEQLARQLAGLSEGVRRLLPDLAADQREALTTQLQQQVPGADGKTADQILDEASGTATAALQRRLPLHVQEVKIFPEAMPLGTLSFTPRLGYRKDKAIEMITAGCYSTLWTVRRFLEEAGGNRDDADKQMLALARQWTGFDWPSGTRLEAQAQLAELQKTWMCRRTGCVFHRAHCAHGAGQGASSV